jgi:hypothetical protein
MITLKGCNNSNHQSMCLCQCDGNFTAKDLKEIQKKMHTVFDQTMIVLEHHNIQFRFNGVDWQFPRITEIQVLDEWTKDGEYHSKWIECPSTLKEVKEFLGY